MFFRQWLEQTVPTADAAGELIRQVRASPVIDAMVQDPGSAGELRGFLMYVGADAAAIAAADEVWARYERSKRQ